jgi:hypothetical protein
MEKLIIKEDMWLERFENSRLVDTTKERTSHLLGRSNL